MSRKGEREGARESFAERWSRRKRGVVDEAAPEADAGAAGELVASAEDDPRDDEEILAELGLPAPETLETPEEVRDFMRAAVPERLRRTALRRLWRLNPMLANLDGLVDYGDDFTDSALVIENLQTAYQVGKGMLRHVEALAAKAAEEGAESEGDAPPADGERGGATDPEEEGEAAMLPDGEEEDSAPAEGDGDTADPHVWADGTPDEGGETGEFAPPLRPARMRFTFEGT